MAAPATDKGHAQLDEADLTDHDIHQLLLEAEGRLRAPGQESSDNVLALADKQSEPAPADASKLSLEHGVTPYISQKDNAAVNDMSASALQNNASNASGLKSIRPKNSSSAKDKPTAGNDWFNLPKTDLTSELKRDLQLLRMRSILDPKRHYKKENGKAQIPEFSQVGTVIEGPTEFFSGRITKKDRKKTLVDESVALERQSGRFASRYNDVQSAKTSGKKGFYKSLKEKRRPKSK